LACTSLERRRDFGHGHIDEFRISHTGRPDGWIETTWNRHEQRRCVRSRRGLPGEMSVDTFSNLRVHVHITCVSLARKATRW
jgi:hypothetical protein